MAGKLISDLNSGTLSIDDAMEIDKDVSGTRTSFKTTVKDIVQFANQNIADEYDSTSTYAVDDYVIYESVLYKCIGTTTGTFDSTKWTSVVVTDEMGSGGGGGTGGHTIIDENGNSMTARAGLQFVGGANVSDDDTNDKTIVDLASAGGIDGVFVDTENVVKDDFTIDGTAHDWIATEDCIVFGLLQANDQYTSAYFNIDGESAFVTLNATTGETAYIPVKKGQTLTYRSKSGTYTRIKAYGIQTGTTHSKFQPVIYSTEEREIGVWKDGKPLYQKTLVVASVGSVGSSLVNIIITNDIPFDFVNVIDANIYDNVDKRWYPLSNIANYSNDSIYIRPYLNKNADPVVFYASLFTGGNTYADLSELNVTIQYTKSTDVAGSGSWTPQGVPTHHYSTDEQIIGTWIDGSTLYEKTYTGLNVDVVYNSWTNVVEVASDIDILVDVKTLSSNTEKHNITGSGIEYYLDKTAHYIKAEYNQNVNRRNIGTITIQYTKSS